MSVPLPLALSQLAGASSPVSMKWLPLRVPRLVADQATAEAGEANTNVADAVEIEGSRVKRGAMERMAAAPGALSSAFRQQLLELCTK